MRVIKALAPLDIGVRVDNSNGLGDFYQGWALKIPLRTIPDHGTSRLGDTDASK